MQVGVMFSGGKDSTFAVWLSQYQGWDVSVLVTVHTRSPYSLMFHYPAIHSTIYQSKALGIRQMLVQPKDEDELEELTIALHSLKREFGIEGLVSGAVASDYQKTRLDSICEAVGLRSFSPLWHKSSLKLVDEIQRIGIRAVVTGVAARGLDESWLGRELDATAWKELGMLSVRYGIHLTGEGGEYESLVVDAPNFHKSIRIEKSHKIWDGQSGYLIVEKASLAEKSIK